MESGVDRAFIRRAVEAADLEALRAALYQGLRDEALAEFAPVSTLAADELARLEDRVVHLLETSRQKIDASTPTDETVREIMDIVLGVPTLDAHFEVRRKMLAFEPYPFLHEPPNAPLEVPDDFNVAIIGAGLAGIAMGVQLSRLGIPFTIYERQAEIGGTWSRNRYPDIRVDTLSITYEFTFDEQYPWSEYFARGAEVRDYLEHTARDQGLLEHARFGCALEDARYDEATDRWQLRFREGAEGDGSEGFETDAKIVVSAAGLFSTPTIPDFPGLEDFDGRVLHPTDWTEQTSIAGERVGVIGNGSTGVQLLAPVRREAAHVSVFQRTPQWIAPRPRYGKAVEPEVRWLLETIPGYWNWCRYTSMIGLFTWHEDFLVPDADWEREGGHITQKSEALREVLVDYIKGELGERRDLIDQLIPDYAPMVRRPVVDNGWYHALTQDNTRLVTNGIRRFTPKGIETEDGQEHAIDTLICATGYDVSTYLWPAGYTGRGGQDLQRFWSEDSPRAYQGMMVPDFPNFFMLYGPNSQPASGGISLPSWFQIWSAYIAQCLERMIEQDLSSVAVTEAAFNNYNQRLDEEASGMAFVTDLNSVEKNYYVNAAGRLQVNSPFETADLYAMQKHPAFDELDFRKR